DKVQESASPFDAPPASMFSTGDDSAADLFSNVPSKSGGAKSATAPTDDDPLADIFGDSGKKKASKPAKGKSAAAKASKQPASDTFGGSKSGVFGGGSAFGDDFEPVAAKPSSGSFAFIDSGMSPGKAAYFKVIPPEIQAAGSEKADIRLIATVGILGFLNIVSLAWLLLNLMKK